jgi:hypothetical protein
MSNVMTRKTDAARSKTRTAAPKAAVARLFFLDLAGRRVMSCNPDGSDLKTIVTDARKLPDGIVVDVEAGHIYWTSMGSVVSNDGSILRADLDGNNDKLYWSDREGMRIMRANLDGSNIETLIETGHGDEDRRDTRKHCVGIALDVDRGHVYWTQKGPDNAGQGRIFRASIDLPKGQTPSARKDIELLYDALPEPIDLDLDLTNRTMYWTDRGDPPRGNTVNRAPMDVTPGVRKDPEIIFNHLMEGIGLALDLKNNRIFMTDLGGSVYSANLDGSNKKNFLFAQGNLSGITYAEIPSTSEKKR